VFKMSYPFLIQGDNVVVVIDNKPHTINKTHITYQKVVDAIKASDWELVKDSIEPKKVVLDYGNGNVSIQGETLFWKGKELNTGLSVRMIQMLQEGFPIEPMVHFMENLYQNPSKRAVTELYGFLEKGNLPITPDGHFLAYKKVRADYTDVHSGKFDNSVGQVVEMERHDVDDNKDNTCSTGLHFCSMSYLSCFGGERTVIVKINPADVVSIPSDYNDAKGRACRYEVIGELSVDPSQAFTKSVQSTAVGSKPVYTGPKLGNSAFYAGYSAGWQDSYDATDNHYGKERRDYREGFEKGSDDRRYSGNERYRYTSANVQAEAWPFPNKG
jgi:hypothetical protein